MTFMTFVCGRKLIKAALFLATFVPFVTAAGQGPSRAGDKQIPPRSSRPKVPVIKVTPRPISDDSPVLPGMRGRLTPPPELLSPGDRSRLLRDSGVDFKTPSAPAEFRLSPRDPYISSAAYLVFSGNIHFSSASNQIFLSLPETNPLSRAIPLPEYPEWLFGERRESGPQPDPPGLVAVRIRIDGPARYLVDFSVSADSSTTYKLKATGADGSGNFPKSPGGQHVIFVFDANGRGYTQIDCWADHSFTFHNVVVTKID